jgi:hypothetical protein
MWKTVGCSMSEQMFVLLVYRKLKIGNTFWVLILNSTM